MAGKQCMGRLRWWAGCLLGAGLMTSAMAEQDLTGALQASKLHADFRLRYETVDDGVNADADGLTLRSRIGLTTGDWHGWSLLGEFVDVRALLGVDDFAPERPGFAVIADPATTEVNRAALRYQGVPGLALGLGRQRIIHGNARFVGNVGWRQNEQTFDGFTASWQASDQLQLSYAWLNQINGITPAADADVDSHLFDLRYDGLPFATLALYAQLLENEDSGDELDSWGLRISGSRDIEDWQLRYAAEFARQETGAGQAADYYRLEAGAGLAGTSLQLNYEVLGSDGGDYGFQTPLATKHGFNGWADKFLLTPAAGLRDLAAVLRTRVADVDLTLAHHWYRADAGSADYGTELNLQALRSFGDHYSLGAKYARYRADTFSDNTSKFWLWAEVRF